MHRRKRFLVYPPDYKPGTGKYKVTHSKFQAMKVARRMGDGAEVNERIRVHLKPRCAWTSSFNGREWIYNKTKD
jgi:hypothetical protein